METIPFSSAHAYAYVAPDLHCLCLRLWLCLCLCLGRSVNQALPCELQTREKSPQATAFQSSMRKFVTPHMMLKRMQIFRQKFVCSSIEHAQVRHAPCDA